MKMLILAGASAMALTTVGCSQAARTGAITTGRLDCPSEQGQLQRVSAAADGKACLYRIGSGTEVSLRLMPLVNGDATATLASVEGELKAIAESGKISGNSKPETALATEAAKVRAEADADAAGGADGDIKVDDIDKSIEAEVNAKLKEKGIDVDNHGSGDTTRINLPGIHITADGDNANVRVGPIHVDARGDTATIRSLETVRLRGEGFSREKRGIRAMLIYAGDNLPNGYRYVGYSASGRKTGPLAVAIVKSKSEDGFHGDIHGDINRLVRRNGGT